MRVSPRLLSITAIALFSACSHSTVAPSAPTPTPAATAGAPADAVLAISAFDVVRSPGDRDHLRASFTLTETGGQSSATLESVLFEDSGERSDLVDRGCWGDVPIRIGPLATFENSVLGYCQPVILTAQPGDSASLSVTYTTEAGQRSTVRAFAVVPRS
jgi:hypothetical protein